MKYADYHEPIPQHKRAELNRKIVYLIDSERMEANGITQEDVYNAYTGIGGLHGLNPKNFESYHQYSEQKKQFEAGQFFTPPNLCELVMSSLRLSEYDLMADLTCGMGNFYNFVPVESNAYGCELDANAYKVARCLYPRANLVQGDVRTYNPNVRFDYVVGNPPFHLKWWLTDGQEMASQLYYCVKAAELLKPMGILALVVPQSFLADSFADGEMIREMELHFRFLGQINLPDNAFAAKGVNGMPTKLQFWQRRRAVDNRSEWRYVPACVESIKSGFSIEAEARKVYERFLQLPKAELEQNKAHVLLELAQEHNASKEFSYTTQKLLYQIKAHPATRDRHAKCCEYLHRFYTQKKPDDMDYEQWDRTKITEPKVLSYLRRALNRQNRKPPQDEVALVKQNDCFVYKAYSAKARSQLTEEMKNPVPIYRAVLDDQPERFPGFERFLRRKRREYDNQNQPFADMEEDPAIAVWLQEFTLWDAENEEFIHLTDTQRHDINLMLQKRYGMLQWEQGTGKTLAAIAMGTYRMQNQGIFCTIVVSSAISIRNNWNEVLPNYGLPYVFVERQKDLARVKRGDFVIITLDGQGKLDKRLKKWVKQHQQNIMFVLDESDEISNPNTKQAKTVLSSFRRCRTKLCTTGTSTRNNIYEFAPQLELLYNNSINMISWCPRVYFYNRDFDIIDEGENSYYGCPIPAYKRGYTLFSASHLPEKPTVFGIGERTQDIYNADVLNDILGKTVITRTFEEVTGKEIRRIQQMPIPLLDEERAVYDLVVQEFHKVQWEYFKSTGNYRKDAMMKLVQQITLMLRVAAAPSIMKEYTGGTPLKVIAAVEMTALWENEIVAIGVRHKDILEEYAKAIREYLPERQLFCVTGSTWTFAQRRALRKTLRESGNGILLCTQQSLPSSVNFDYVNKILIPEMHYNNSRMSQFYMRFIRFTSTEFKDIYFLNYLGSLESNLLRMVMAKEKINQFMKGKDANLDAIHKKFGVDYDLLALLMHREEDENGHFHIRWGEQVIA